MKQARFEQLVQEQIKRCEKTLLTKGKGYAAEQDRLDHFKRAGAMLGTSPEEALAGMASKHFISVAKLCQEKPADLKIWDEKIGDAINYLLILAALIREK